MIYILIIKLLFNNLLYENNNGWKSLFNGKNLKVTLRYPMKIIIPLKTGLVIYFIQKRNLKIIG